MSLMSLTKVINKNYKKKRWNKKKQLKINLIKWLTSFRSIIYKLPVKRCKFFSPNKKLTKAQKFYQTNFTEKNRC